MLIRRGGVTGVPWTLPGLEIKSSYLFNTSPRFKYGLVISQIRVLASHTGSLGSVAQGSWQLEDLAKGRCHFLSDP